MRLWLVLAAPVVLLFPGRGMAANPADATSFFRYTGEFYQYANDGGPWHLFAGKPLDSKTYLMFYNWNAQNSRKHQYELGVTRKLKKNFQVGLIADTWTIGDDTIRLMADYSVGKLGLGAVVPTESDQFAKIGARFKSGDYTIYAQVTECGTEDARLGLSYVKNGRKLELAYCDNTWYFRASKRMGKVAPELRTRFTPTENFVGFSLTYYP